MVDNGHTKHVAIKHSKPKQNEKPGLIVLHFYILQIKYQIFVQDICNLYVKNCELYTEIANKMYYSLMSKRNTHTHLCTREYVKGGNMKDNKATERTDRVVFIYKLER